MELKKDATVKDLVDLFNEGTIKYQDIQDTFQVSRDLIKKRLAGIGLHFSQTEKKFLGEATEEALTMKLSKFLERQRSKPSNKEPNASNEAREEIASTIETPVNEINVKASKKEVPTKATNKVTNKANSELDSIDKLLLQNESASEQRVYRGFYWDPDIIDFLDNVKHGNKSDLMNEIVRSVLKAKGLIR